MTQGTREICDFGGRVITGINHIVEASEISDLTVFKLYTILNDYQWHTGAEVRHALDLGQFEVSQVVKQFNDLNTMWGTHFFVKEAGGSLPAFRIVCVDLCQSIEDGPSKVEKINEAFESGWTTEITIPTGLEDTSNP